MAQEPSLAVIHNGFDQVVGIQNTMLYQGVAHTESYRTINEKTPYFITPQFLKGSVRYTGQDYYGLDLKYDVFEDQVLIKLVPSVGGARLELIRDRVAQFHIDGHKFVLLRPSDIPQIDIYGFYEAPVETGHMSLYIKHAKKKLDRTDRGSVYSEFVKVKSTYLLHVGGGYHNIGSKKELIALFPEHKKQINEFYGSQSRLKKVDPDSFHISLIKHINALYANTQ